MGKCYVSASFLFNLNNSSFHAHNKYFYVTLEGKRNSENHVQKQRRQKKNSGVIKNIFTNYQWQIANLHLEYLYVKKWHSSKGRINKEWNTAEDLKPHFFVQAASQGQSYVSYSERCAQLLKAAAFPEKMSESIIFLS